MASEECHDLHFYVSVKHAMERISVLPKIGTVATEPQLEIESLEMAKSYSRKRDPSLPALCLRRHIIEALVSAGARGLFASSGPIMTHEFELTIEQGKTMSRIYPNFSNERPISSATVKEICDLAIPSGYGDLLHQRTVINTRVRDALEIPYPSANLEPNSFCKTAFKAVKSSLSILQGGGREKYTFKPLKLNIYRPGGHFEDHVDTPVAPNMIATFIVHIPTEDGCVGGELEISPPPGSAFTEPFVWRLSNEPSWTLFFGDCRHRVLPVTAGTRLTYTFAVLSEPGAASECNADDICCATIERTIDAEAEWTIPPHLIEWLLHKPLGILLRHEYPLVPDPNGLMLKGIDRMLCSAVRAAYPDAFLSFVVYNVRCRFEEGYKENHEFMRIDNVHAFSVPILRQLRFGEKIDPPAFMSEAFNNKKIPFVALDDVENGLELRKQSEEIGYTGNECRGYDDTCTYCALALLIPCVNPSGADSNRQEYDGHDKDDDDE